MLWESVFYEKHIMLIVDLVIHHISVKSITDNR